MLVATPKAKLILSTMWSRLVSLKWIHCNFAGVDHVLFPELVQSSVTLTNAKGLYSSSLAEYAIMAMSYYAKDVVRLNRQKEKHCKK